MSKRTMIAIIGFAALGVVPVYGQVKGTKPPAKAQTKPASKPKASSPAKPKSVPTPAPTPAPVKQLSERETLIIGKYTADKPAAMTIDLTNEAGSVMLQASGYPAIPVEFKTDDSLYNAIIAGQIDAKVVRDASGKPNGIELKTAGNVILFQKQGATPIVVAAAIQPPKVVEVKPIPKPEEKPVEKPAATKLPDILGKYTVDTKDGPAGDGEIKYEMGKFILALENQPEMEIEVGDKDEIKSKKLPEGVTAKFLKDKEGKVIGISAESPAGMLTWTRKTFVKLPDAPKPAAVSDKLKGAEGTYVTDFAGAPEINLTVKDGKVTLQADGQPDLTIEVNDKDEFVSMQLKDMNFELKFSRDKDGKIDGIKANTPFGEIVFKKK